MPEVKRNRIVILLTVVAAVIVCVTDYYGTQDRRAMAVNRQSTNLLTQVQTVAKAVEGGRIDFLPLNKTLTGFNARKTTKTYITNADGELVTPTRFNVIGDQMTHKTFSRAIAEKKPGVWVTEDSRGEQVVSAYTAITHDGEALVVIAEMDISEIHGQVWRWWYMTDQLGATLVALLVTMISWSNRKVRPATIRRDIFSDQGELDMYKMGFVHNPMGKVLVDEQMIIIAANNSFAEMLGYSIKELEGSHINDLLPANMHESHTRKFLEYIWDRDSVPIRSRRITAVNKTSDIVELQLSVGRFDFTDGDLEDHNVGIGVVVPYVG